MEFDSKDELDRVTNFIIFKRDIVEDVVEDDDLTKMAIIYFVISIIITVISTIVTFQVDYTYQVATYGAMSYLVRTPTIISISMNAISQGMLPVFGWIFTWQAGIWFKTENDSKETILRTFGYSRFLVIIGQACSFLSLIYSIYFAVMLVEFLFTIWALILIIYSVMIVLKKSAWITICVLIVAGIISLLCILPFSAVAMFF